MIDYNYNFEIRTLLTHFSSALNDVKINRYDGKKFEKELLKVPLTYAPKSHILNDIIGLTDTIRFPIMAVEITSQSRDNERIKNKISDLIYKNSDGTFKNAKAIPWNIEMRMTILTKYQEDMDQIVQNFATYFNPYIVISWQEPKSGRELRTEVLWKGEISYEYPGKDQGPKDPPYRISATTDFTIKGWIFSTNRDNDSPICLINTSYNYPDKFYCDYSALLENSYISSTETYTITGRPVVQYVSPYFIVEGQTPKIKLDGYSFGNVNAVFLSGSNPDMYPMNLYQPFSALPAFSAYPVSYFQKTENSLTFNLPPTSADGFLDIILVNSCGYGKLTEDSNRCSRVQNPYPTTSPEHYSWTVSQFPYMNGLIIADFFDPYVIDYTDMFYEYSEVTELDKEAMITKIKEIMQHGNITIAELL